MSKGNLPPIQQPQVSLTDILPKTHAVCCDSCGSGLFDSVTAFRHISAIISPNGQDTFLPLQVFACRNCGSLLEPMLPTGLTSDDIHGITRSNGGDTTAGSGNIITE